MTTASNRFLTKTTLRFLEILLLLLFITLATRLYASAQPLNVVNVNTANETQLCYLPGIGEVLASRIIEYREGADDGKHKVFRSLDDLANVKGLGEVKLSKLRPYVVFSGPTTTTEKIHAPRPGRTTGH